MGEVPKGYQPTVSGLSLEEASGVNRTASAVRAMVNTTDDDLPGFCLVGELRRVSEQLGRIAEAGERIARAVESIAQFGLPSGGASR